MMNDKQKGRVVHIQDHVAGAVYIGRYNSAYGVNRSKWYNPFKIPMHGTRAQVINMYRFYITEGEGQHLLAHLEELRDKPLACWCRHDGETPNEDNACHGDVLLDLLNDSH